MQIRSFLPAFLTLVTAACGDSPLGSRAAAGYYRLESVNGQPLPYVAPPSSGFVEVIDYGDLLLRGSGAFSLGVRAIGGGYMTGRYRVDDDELRLTVPAPEPGQPAFDITGTADGDSVVVDLGTAPSVRRYLFRRDERDPAPIAPGLYTLRAIDDDAAAPFLRYEEVSSGNRHTATVLYDSIQFVDAVFYRRHRAESARTDWSDGNFNESSRAWTVYGAYDRSANGVVLRPYWSFDEEDDATLTLDNGALVRHSVVSGVATEERFGRQR